MTIRVLHCPTDTGGNAWALSRAERALGVHSDVMVRQSSWLGYRADVDLQLRRGSVTGRALRLLSFLVKAARSYDVFHFNWGMSMLDFWRWHLHYLEFPLLARLGKKIVVTYQGCDARLKEESRERFETSACAECDVAWCTPQMDAIRRRRVRKVARYAQKVFALNPDLMHVLPSAEFLPYACVAPEHAGPEPPAGPRPPGPLRVVHLSTNRSIKGTRYIEQACATLTRSGLPVDLRILEGVPHDQVTAVLAGCDVVVDQLLVGWYGASAVEAMALGKPVLCFLRDDDLKRFVPFHQRIPIVRTSRRTLAEDLRRLAEDWQRCRDAGEAGRRFVREVHDPRVVAARTVEIYRDLCAA